MAYTAAQQAKITAAQTQLDKAKTAYQGWVSTYDSSVAEIQPCYKNPIESAVAAASWFNPTKPPCMSAGSCKVNDCKAVIDALNGSIIPGLRSAYGEFNAAQANFDKVLAEVASESQNDPDVIQANNVAVTAAEAAELVKKYKYIFYSILLLLIGGGIYAFFRLRKTQAA